MCLQSIMSPQDEQWRLTSLLCNFLVLLSTTVCSQNINKQNVNIADETLTDYSFLSRYHYTKSKNYLKRRYRIRHWIPIILVHSHSFTKPFSLNSANKINFFNQVHVKSRSLQWNFIYFQKIQNNENLNHQFNDKPFELKCK